MSDSVVLTQQRTDGRTDGRTDRNVACSA